MTTGEGVALGLGALVLLGGGYMVLSNTQQSQAQTQALAQQLSQTQAQLAAAQAGGIQGQAQPQPKQNGVLGAIGGFLNSGAATALLQFASEQLN